MNGTNGTSSLPHGVQIIGTVNVTVLILIFLFGMVGNALTVVVLRAKKLRQSSTAVYLTALAIVDMLYLLASLLVSIINYTILFPSDIRYLSAVACKLSPFLHYTLAYLSVWLMVAVTVDRAIWVARPFRAKGICTQRNACITITVLSITLIVMDAHFFWTMDYKPATTSEGHHECSPKYFAQHIFPYIDMLLICALPFSFMLVSNIMIGWQLKRMREFNRRRQASTVGTRVSTAPPSAIYTAGVDVPVETQGRFKGKKRSHRHEFKDSIKVKSNTERSSSLTTMLVAISVFFMISVLPLMIYDVAYYALGLQSWLETEDPWRITCLYGIERFVYALWYTNFAVHYILYCLNGPPFRAEALLLFRSSCCHRRRRKALDLENTQLNGSRRDVEVTVSPCMEPTIHLEQLQKLQSANQDQGHVLSPVQVSIPNISVSSAPNNVFPVEKQTLHTPSVTISVTDCNENEIKDTNGCES